MHQIGESLTGVGTYVGATEKIELKKIFLMVNHGKRLINILSISFFYFKHWGMKKLDFIQINKECPTDYGFFGLVKYSIDKISRLLVKGGNG